MSSLPLEFQVLFIFARPPPPPLLLVYACIYTVILQSVYGANLFQIFILTLLPNSGLKKVDAIK